MRMALKAMLATWLRRRLWRMLFAPAQQRLGSFFLDPRDHIGRERLVVGDVYEAAALGAIDELIEPLGLGRGMAIDVGANIGNHACRFVRQFQHVLCVEPGRVAGLVLEANLTASGQCNWQIEHCALGELEGSGTLCVIDQVNLGSSRVFASETGRGQFPVHTGDNLLAASETPKLPVTFIKLDVEGAELAALKGLRQTLSRDHPLICVEALDKELWKAMQDFLSAIGYTTYLVLTRELARVTFPRLTPAANARGSLGALPDLFRPGGYEMVFCLTAAQARLLAASEAKSRTAP